MQTFLPNWFGSRYDIYIVLNFQKWFEFKPGLRSVIIGDIGKKPSISLLATSEKKLIDSCCMRGSILNNNQRDLCINAALCPEIDVCLPNVSLQLPSKYYNHLPCMTMETEGQEGQYFSKS